MDRFAIIGLGRFGLRLATLLAEAGAEVIAVDRSREIVEQVRDKVTLAVCLDGTDEKALRAQGIDQVDVAVVGIGAAFEDSALITVLLKQLGLPRVISRATTTMRGRILQRIGADDTVNPERESADRWRDRLLAPAIMSRIDLAEGYGLTQLPAPDSFIGKTLAQLNVRHKYEVNIVAIRRTVEQTDTEGLKRTKQTVISVPMADTDIQSGDILLVIGSDEAMANFPAR